MTISTTFKGRGIHETLTDMRARLAANPDDHYAVEVIQMIETEIANDAAQKRHRMGKPPATILLAGLDGYDRPTDVLEAPDAFVVCFRGQTISLRRKANHRTLYAKVSFPRKGHALRLAKMLNEAFRTSDFTVNRLIVGEVVT